MSRDLNLRGGGTSVLGRDHPISRMVTRRGCPTPAQPTGHVTHGSMQDVGRSADPTQEATRWMPRQTLEVLQHVARTARGMGRSGCQGRILMPRFGPTRYHVLLPRHYPLASERQRCQRSIGLRRPRPVLNGGYLQRATFPASQKRRTK